MVLCLCVCVIASHDNIKPPGNSMKNKDLWGQLERWGVGLTFSLVISDLLLESRAETDN